MAEKSRRIKKTESVRDRAAKAAVSKQPRRLQRTAASVKVPLIKARQIGGKSYQLPLPDNRLGRILGKQIRVRSSFFSGAWGELRQVQWPTAKETIKLTFAVFIFALAFGALISATDYGLDKIFRKVLLND